MKLKNKEIRSLWYKKIFFYLKSGQSLAESVRTASEDADTLYIYEELVDGARFSDVCELPELTKVFSRTEVSLLRVAEQTGSMQFVCGVLAQMLKEQYAQFQKLMGALVYPILVLLMACGLLLMILVGIVPKIGPLFSSMETVPFATRALIAVSEHMVSYWYIDICITLILFLSLIYVKKKTTYYSYLVRIIQYISLKSPYLKEVYLYWYIERWIQITHISLLSKVSLLQSLQFAHEGIANVQIQNEFMKVTEGVRAGQSCSDSLNLVAPFLKYKLKDWISVISSGEKTGTLQEVFGVSREHIGENLKDAFDKAQKIVEPMLIILVGIMVLCICLAIILPMYQLTQSVQ